MQIPIVEREPASIDGRFQNGNQGISSQAVFDSFLASMFVIEDTYRLGSPNQVQYSEVDFLAWLGSQTNKRQNSEYELLRGVSEVCDIMALDGPHQIFHEVNGRDILEVGPGLGVLAQSLARHSRSLTLVDSDMSVLQIETSPLPADIILDPIQKAEIDMDRFDRVFDVFAALIWGTDMRSTLLALYKEISVTKVGGSLFAVPLFTRMLQRANKYHSLNLEGSDIPPEEAFRDFRDYTMGRGLIRLMGEGLIAPTFGLDIWDKEEDGSRYEDEHDRLFDSVWAVIDKSKTTQVLPPKDLMSLGYALQEGEPIITTMTTEIGVGMDDLPISDSLSILHS